MDAILNSPSPLSDNCPSPENSELRHSVVMVLTHGDREWKPKSRRTPFPVQHETLPLEFARSLATFLNATYRKIGKNRLAVVTRKPTGTKGKFGVHTVAALPDPLCGGSPVLDRVRATGLNYHAAVGEAEKINQQIIELATVPKVWAVIVVEDETIPAESSSDVTEPQNAPF